MSKTSGLYALISSAALFGNFACKDPNSDAISPDSPPENQLMDPALCQQCHPVHYREWAGSMHAYAADDPVFLAMNARGQRETLGELGDFCVRCHAPVATSLGLTTDGLNLASLPQWSKGVTCYFCHQANAIADTHNNPIQLAHDEFMRGGVEDPAPALQRLSDSTPVHQSRYSELHDGSNILSSPMCGSCHDIVNPAGTHIERTYYEWIHSNFNDAVIGLSCSSCHMPADDQPVANSPGAKARFGAHHSHHFAGPDIALTPFPDPASDAEHRAEQKIARDALRANVVCASLCVLPESTDPNAPPVASLWLHNEGSGHHWPSGATADRRAWVELRALDAAQQDRFVSGIVPPSVAAREIAASDPNMWLFHEPTYNQQGLPTHMFWEVFSSTPEILPVNDFNSVNDSERTTWRERRYVLTGFDRNADIARLKSALHFRAMGFDVLDDLIASGDLDPIFRDRIETDTIAPASLNWPSGPAIVYSDTGYGLCVATSDSCRSPFICSTPFGCTEPTTP